MGLWRHRDFVCLLRLSPRFLTQQADPTLHSGIRGLLLVCHDDILNCFSPHLDSVNTCQEECRSSGKVVDCGCPLELRGALPFHCRSSNSFFEGLRSRDLEPLLVPCPTNISVLPKDRWPGAQLKRQPLACSHSDKYTSPVQRATSPKRTKNCTLQATRTLDNELPEKGLAA